MAGLILAQASSILDRALEEGRRQNFAPLAVAVLDAGGHLIAFKREDGAGFARFDIAYGKAWGSLGMGFGTRELAERAARFPTFVAAIAVATQGRMARVPRGKVAVVDMVGDRPQTLAVVELEAFFIDNGVEISRDRLREPSGSPVER